MLRWLDKIRTAPAAIPEVNSTTDLEELLNREAVILFKHSTACPVSWTAHAHVTRFLKENTSIPVYLVPVIRERALSRKIAERVGVRHESPQVILVSRGVATYSASHGEITERLLAGMLAQMPVRSAGAIPLPA